MSDGINLFQERAKRQASTGIGMDLSGWEWNNRPIISSVNIRGGRDTIACQTI